MQAKILLASGSKLHFIAQHFTKLTFAWQIFANNFYTKFRENPTISLAADSKSRPKGWGLHTRRLVLRLVNEI